MFGNSCTRWSELHYRSGWSILSSSRSSPWLLKVLGHLVKGNEYFIGIDYQLSDLYTISIWSNNILMLHVGGKSNLSFFFRGVSQNRGGGGLDRRAFPSGRLETDVTQNSRQWVDNVDSRSLSSSGSLHTEQLLLILSQLLTLYSE